MIPYPLFQEIVINRLGRQIDAASNPDQHQAISAPINLSQFLVAGPGSGKTTVMVLKILKFILVDGVPPSSILATTFTRKAAAELRSRILGWADQIRQHLQTDPKRTDYLLDWDINQIITGTLDSISEDVLRTNRDPGAAPPVIIEEFVAQALMLREGLFKNNRYQDPNLKDFIKKIRGSDYGLNTAEVAHTLLEIKDRLYYDQVNFQELKDTHIHPGASIAWQCIDNYSQYLEEHMLYDFSRLEAQFLDDLIRGRFDKFTDGLKLVLVDEYQDSNLLQEQIYFQLAEKALANGGSFTVVGDDDQSLYRFRGATVDLFTQFQERVKLHLNIDPEIIYLSQNYRSTPSIVSFCNSFIDLDEPFQGVRVGHKPSIKPARRGDYTDYPVLGMFRKNKVTLARDLANFIHLILYGEGFHFEYDNNEYIIRADPVKGSAADIAVLLSSPSENNSSSKPRLPLLLRQNLEVLNPKIEVFNPRGQELERISSVNILAGLLLECIDPYSRVQDSMENLPGGARRRFREWRMEANRYISHDPPPNSPLSLKEYVDAWRERKPRGRKTWKREVSLIGMAYRLVSWIPSLREDVEGLVYLEAVTRTMAQTGLFNLFGGDIIHDPGNPRYDYLSIREALWNVFVPLATGIVDVDENLLETLPDNRINIMSIHQAKGLEFPLVVVDVGSDFIKNFNVQEFKRFPREGGKPCRLEDMLREYSPLKKPIRSGRDRAFDDLIRQYFVAFSRPQDILLLVGVNPVKDGYKNRKGYEYICNVATGWTRDNKWPWRGLKNLKLI